MAEIEAYDRPESFGMGRVVARTFEVFGKNFISFCSLAVLIIVPQMILEWSWVARNFVPGAPGMSFVLWSSVARLGVIFVASLILSSVLQAALVHGTIATLNGKPAKFIECLLTGLESLPKVVRIGFLEGVFILLGFVLFVVPGLIALVMLCVSVPSAIVEKKPVLDSLSRSAELTSGHRWAIFGLLVVFILACFVLGLAIRPLVGLSIFPAPHSPFPLNSAFWIASTIVKIVTTSIAAVLAASIYYELRTIKEGIGPEQLAAVFA
jgi:hypothetical protein